MITPNARRDAEFGMFVESATRYLTRTAFLLTGSPQLADDLVQETLVRTYTAWWRVRPEDALGYARRVLVNLTIDGRRKRSLRTVEWADVAAIGDAEQRVDDRDQVARMLASLAPQQRRVIVLRYFGDLSTEETAACLGISSGAVKSACSRGLAHLRDTFAPVLEGETR